MNFLFGEISPFSYFEPIKLNFSDRDARELQNTDVMRLAHSSYLAVSSLVELEARDNAAVDISDLGDLDGKGSSAVELDGFAEDSEVVG